MGITLHPKFTCDGCYTVFEPGIVIEPDKMGAGLIMAIGEAQHEGWIVGAKLTVEGVGPDIATYQMDDAVLCDVCRSKTTGGERDPHEDARILLLIAGVEVPREIIESWTEEECEEASHWAAMVHTAASDNDDVEVPLTPKHVSPYWHM